MKPILFAGFLNLRFTYIAWVLIFFCLLITANGYTHPQIHADKAFLLRKDDPRPRMFLIAVADTDDDSIGKRCAVDLEDVADMFEDIADRIHADMPKPKIISGKQFGKAAVTEAIDNWLRSQKLLQSDIVIFYYTGHGFRYPGDASRYPRMWLKTAGDKDIEHNNLRMEEDVYNRILKMGAGLNIVISDCCNNRVGDDGNIDNITVTARERKKHTREQSDDENDDANYGDKLFLVDHPVSILVTAADTSELAGGTADEGGFFTGYFLDALDMCVYDNSIPPSWKDIFNYADDNAGYWAKSANCPAAKHNEQGRCVQDAVVKIVGAE